MKKIILPLIKITAVLSVIQLLRFSLKSFIFLFTERNNFSDRAVSCAVMLVLTVLFTATAHFKKIKLSVFPPKFGAFYITATVVFAAVLAVTPFITDNPTFYSVFMLIYSSVVTPLFEELIFRGYVWNTLDSAFHSGAVNYIASSLFFGLWHLGYADSLMLRADGNLGVMLFWKAVTGLCFGLVLGAVRYKTKNCYSTMLLHGIMNVFGR